MNNIEQLAREFRKAIEMARDAGEFVDDCVFYSFPQGCCGDASNLLGQYLLKNGIKTHYVCGEYSSDTFEDYRTHAWLLIDNHIIIDITGDQFKDNSSLLNYDKTVYVGSKDDFHKLFDVQNNGSHECKGVYEFDGSSIIRLCELYRKIIKYI